MNQVKKIYKLSSKRNINIIDFAVPIINIHYPLKHSPNRKYDNKYYFTCLLDFLQTSVCWTKYKGTIDYPISGKYLNSIHLKYIKHNVYNEINKELLKAYLQTDKETKIKYQIIDASFIPNKQGTHNLSDKPVTKRKNIKKCKNGNISKRKLRKQTKKVKNIKKYENNINNKLIQFNRYGGRKKYIKLSAITDSYGVPFTCIPITGSGTDVNSLEETHKSIVINLNTKKNSNNNRYKQYFIGDTGYSSLKNKKYLRKVGYTPIIKYNVKNTKDINIIKKNKFNEPQNELYKKRKIVESFFSWIKRFPSIDQQYQKTIKSYNGLLSLACSIIISKKI